MGDGHCPVCLEPMGDGQTVFRKSCGHDQHWRCVHSRLPFACFVCRAAWTPEDAANANDLQTAVFIDSPIRTAFSPSPIAAARVAEVPMDVMPLCCIRNEFNESSMHFAPERFRNGIVQDSWVCYVCGNEFFREQLHAVETPAHYNHYCDFHERPTATICQCILGGLPTAIGFACVTPCGTALNAVPCRLSYRNRDMTTDTQPDPPRISWESFLGGLESEQLLDVDMLDDDLNIE